MYGNKNTSDRALIRALCPTWGPAFPWSDYRRRGFMNKRKTPLRHLRAYICALAGIMRRIENDPVVRFHTWLVSDSLHFTPFLHIVSSASHPMMQNWNLAPKATCKAEDAFTIFLSRISSPIPRNSRLYRASRRTVIIRWSCRAHHQHEPWHWHYPRHSQKWRVEISKPISAWRFKQVFGPTGRATCRHFLAVARIQQWGTAQEELIPMRPCFDLWNLNVLDNITR